MKVETMGLSSQTQAWAHQSQNFTEAKAAALRKAHGAAIAAYRKAAGHVPIEILAKLFDIDTELWRQCERGTGAQRLKMGDEEFARTQWRARKLAEHFLHAFVYSPAVEWPNVSQFSIAKELLAAFEKNYKRPL